MQKGSTCVNALSFLSYYELSSGNFYQFLLATDWWNSQFFTCIWMKNLVIFFLTNWRILQYLSQPTDEFHDIFQQQMDKFHDIFLRSIDQFYDFYPTTYWINLLFFNMTNRQISWFFLLWLIDKFHDIFCNWFANFMISFCKQIDEIYDFFPHIWSNWKISKFFLQPTREFCDIFLLHIDKFCHIFLWLIDDFRDIFQNLIGDLQRYFHNWSTNFMIFILRQIKEIHDIFFPQPIDEILNFFLWPMDVLCNFFPPAT